MAETYVHPRNRDRQSQRAPTIEVPSQPMEADPASRLGQLAATWQRRAAWASQKVTRCRELQQRLDAAQELLRTAGPDADLLECAKAQAAVPILQRALAAEAPARIGDQESADAAQREMNDAFQRLQSLVRQWNGTGSAYDREGVTLTDDALTLELAELLGDKAVPYASDVRRRQAEAERGRLRINDWS